MSKRSTGPEPSRTSIERVRTTDPGSTSLARSAIASDAARFTFAKPAISTPISSGTNLSLSRVSSSSGTWLRSQWGTPVKTQSRFVFLTKRLEKRSLDRLDSSLAVAGP
jgi:hypothetical protein